LASRFDEAGLPGPEEILESFPGPFGLYLHVPFCRSICPYCPYNNELLPGAGAVTPLLATLRRLGYLERQPDGRLHLSDRGLDHYHDVERLVTYRLIEPLWEEMLAEHPAHDRPRRLRRASTGRRPATGVLRRRGSAHTRT